MNYIAEINAFERWLESNFLPAGSQLLWYKLIMLNNRAGWLEWIVVDNRRLMVLMQAGSENTFIRARDRLTESGLVAYKKGKKGSPNRYHICSLCKNTAKIEVQTEVQTEVISKQNKNKTKEGIPPTPFQKIKDEYNRICVSFPKLTVLSDARKKAIRARIVSGYGDDDFVRLFQKAESSSFLKGGNNRNWNANFDWLIKDTNMAKVLDGNYDERKPQQEFTSGIDWSGFDDE